MRYKDITGERFGPWTATERVGHDKYYNAIWRARNDEGYEKDFTLQALARIRKSGKTPESRRRNTNNIAKQRKNYLFRQIPISHWEKFTKKCHKRNIPRIERIRELMSEDMAGNIPEEVSYPDTSRSHTFDYPLIGFDPQLWFDFKGKCILADKPIKSRLLELIWFDIVN